MKSTFSALFAIGALAWTAPAAATVIDFSTMALNGYGATATPTVLTLNNGVGGEATSAYLPTAISTASSFSGSFTFTLTNVGYTPQADGISFIIQNDPAGLGAVGLGGGYIGAYGLANNLGIAFQSWYNNHATIFRDGDVYHGTQPTGNFNLGDQSDVVNVSFNYTPGVFSYSATNVSTGRTVSDSFGINLATLGPQAYVGFTGGTGLSYAQQTVSDFSFTVVPEPATWAMLALGFGLLGVALRRTPARARPQRSANS